MQELFIVAGAHLLAVMSPGPDFAVILKMALSSGRHTALYGSLGVALGILVHVMYSLVGIALIISQSIVLFNTIKLLGALYLIWIGIKSLKSKKQSAAELGVESTTEEIAPISALKTGFIANVLNPKATLFFLSLFTQVISTTTPGWIKAAYGIEMATATFTWFALVSIVITRPAVRKSYSKLRHIIDRAFGAVLVSLGVKVALGSR